MRYTFYFSNHNNSKLASELTQIINNTVILSTDEYNQFITKINTVVKQHPLKERSSLYNLERLPIQEGKPLTEKTPWGGVSLKKVDTAKDFIQKLLVIKKYGVLGFEIHRKKLEKLYVREGACLFIFSNHTVKNWKKGDVQIVFAQKGDKITLLPGDEHGIFAITNCVIEETSTNHLDDLVYIFKGEQII